MVHSTKRLKKNFVISDPKSKCEIISSKKDSEMCLPPASSSILSLARLAEVDTVSLVKKFAVSKRSASGKQSPSVHLSCSWQSAVFSALR